MCRSEEGDKRVANGTRRGAEVEVLGTIWEQKDGHVARARRARTGRTRDGNERETRVKAGGAF